MSSIRWTAATRTEMRQWGLDNGRPPAHLIRTALETLAADPTGALATARPWITTSGTGTSVPILHADRDRWAAAEDALTVAYGPVVATGVVVRALVVAQLHAADAEIVTDAAA